MRRAGKGCAPAAGCPQAPPGDPGAVAPPVVLEGLAFRDAGCEWGVRKGLRGGLRRGERRGDCAGDDAFETDGAGMPAIGGGFSRGRPGL